MENLNLNAEIRSTEEKISNIKADKKVPAVVYGKNQESISIKVSNSDLIKTFRQAGESHIINLEVEGKTIEVLFHDIQRHHITGDFSHVDFLAVTRGEKVHTKIALSFTGESQAIKEGAILDEHIKEIEVKVLPKNLVDSIEVDLAVLKTMGDNIRVSDLTIDSSKFDVLTNADDIVVSASKPAKIETTEEVSEETTEEEAK